MSDMAIFQQLWNGKKMEDAQNCLAQIESRSKFYLRPTILIASGGGLFPDGFPAEGSVYSILAA